MDNIGTVITPAMATYLIGLLYRNTRTSCVSLALLCARVSHDTLRRVLYQTVRWSRRLWDTFVQGLVQSGRCRWGCGSGAKAVHRKWSWPSGYSVKRSVGGCSPRMSCVTAGRPRRRFQSVRWVGMPICEATQDYR